MNVKKLVLAGLAGFVIMLLLNGLWHMVLMSDYYRTNFADVERAEPIIIWIVIAALVGSFLLAYIYPFGYKGGSPIKEGMRFGLLMGLVMAVPSMLSLYGVYTIPLTGTLIEIIFQIVLVTIGGIVIGFVYGSGAKARSE